MSSPGEHADRRRLTRFGLTLAVGFAVVGTLSWWRGHTVAPVVSWTAAGVLAALSFAAPALLAGFERTWLALGTGLAWINTRIILTALFYTVLTPIGVLMRLFYDPLDRRIDERRSSYWVRRTSAPFDATTSQRQF